MRRALGRRRPVPRDEGDAAGERMERTVVVLVLGPRRDEVALSVLNLLTSRSSRRATAREHTEQAWGSHGGAPPGPSSCPTFVLGGSMAAALIIAVGVVLAASIGSAAYVVAARRSAAPVRDLARAVRVLDRILAYDDAVTSLSAELRQEALQITRAYNKELS